MNKMEVNKDIKNREDIKIIIDAFYEKVKLDDTIGFIFNDIAKVNWTDHLPIMYDFWEATVLGTAIYARNAMAPHFKLNEKVKLTSTHFDRWVLLFTETIDGLFAGANAEAMKIRGKNIAGLMLFKMGDENKLRIV